MNNIQFLHRCLTLAAKGRGLVGANPLVGSVIVRGEKIISEGCYRGPGTDHAEVDAIKKCDQDITPEDRLYVNLEPCNHQGETPPCTDAIIASGISYVVYGMSDPDSRVSGKGIETLRSAGITVEGPVCRAQCERLNKGYISLRKKGRPYITLKRAQTIDGKIANPDGSKRRITSDEQNAWSHKHLRATHDAILVGVQTVITDDPQLTNRITNNESQITNNESRITNHKLQITNHQPIKIILDPHLRIPINAKVVREGTIIVKKDAKDAEESEDAKEMQLKEKGATILSVPTIDNHFNWHHLNSQLSTLSSSILVEGGPTTWNAFTAAGIVDEEVILTG